MSFTFKSRVLLPIIRVPVKSRMITKIFYEQFGLLCVPYLEHLEWRIVVQVFLRDVMIIQVDEAFECGLKGGG